MNALTNSYPYIKYTKINISFLIQCRLSSSDSAAAAYRHRASGWGGKSQRMLSYWCYQRRRFVGEKLENPWFRRSLVRIMSPEYGVDRFHVRDGFLQWTWLKPKPNTPWYEVQDAFTHVCSCRPPLFSTKLILGLFWVESAADWVMIHTGALSELSTAFHTIMWFQVHIKIMFTCD